ncbi:MAG TPA: hypothetical protein VFF31_01440 [Blastocatellia bacterium]|jgi:hypothetical protein|nr:hypothetical protein [Blastocatellia bacterium]
MSHHVSQHRQRAEVRAPSDLKTPVRNLFFWGKLLDVYHLEMEQEYFNSKRWLLNRLVTGPGVVCGLDVQLTDDEKSVVVYPGVAIDRCGREIIVAAPSRAVELPPMPRHDYDESKDKPEAKHARPERHGYCEEEYAHVVICYHECETDPAPAMAGDCESVTLCAAGSVREQYEVQVRQGFAPERKSGFPDVIEGRRISYGAIAEYVTRACRPLPDDCCLPLANVRLRDTDHGWEPEIDISVRPIVYTNRLLFELIQSMVKQEQGEY